MAPPDAPRAYVGTCPTCGKRRYANRRKARQAARTLHPGETLRAYECSDGYWHFGHNRRPIARR